MMSIINELEKYLIKNNIQVSQIAEKKKWRLQQCWRKKFSSQVKADKGRWVIADRDWHTFSYNYFPHCRGYKAEVEFNRVLSEKIVIAFSRDDIPAYYGKCTQAPKSEVFTFLLADLPELEDIYLSDLDLTWTMVFVHEENLGPFFAQSEY